VRAAAPSSLGDSRRKKKMGAGRGTPTANIEKIPRSSYSDRDVQEKTIYRGKEKVIAVVSRRDGDVKNC